MQCTALTTPTLRPLTEAEIELVSGGTRTVTYTDTDGAVVTEYWSDDGSTFYGLSADYSSMSDPNWFASIGWSGLIGMSFEFGGDGLLPDWGDVSFAAGVGVYLDFGVASNQALAQEIAQGGDDYLIIGTSLDGGIDGDLSGSDRYVSWSGGGGVMVADNLDAQ